MDLIRKLTRIYGLGICCGLWSKAEVIQWCDKLIEASDSPPYEIMRIGMSNSEEEDNLFNVDQEESQKLRIQSTRLLIFCYENIIFGQAVFGFGEDYLKLNCLYTRSRVMRKIVC